MTKKKTKSQLKKQADKLFSEIIRKKGACQMCGKTSNLQAAHIVTRSNLHLRYDFNNALCLCSGCHLFKWHKEPLWAVMWFQNVYPKEYKYLMKEKDKVAVYMDYEAIIKSLRSKATRRRG